MTASGLLCLVTYLLIAFSRVPALGLIGCGLCGFSVGIFWPGTFSISAVKIRRARGRRRAACLRPAPFRCRAAAGLCNI